MRPSLHAIVLALSLAGCASSGVVPMDKGTYALTKMSPGCGFASGEASKIELYKEANEFCSKQSKVVETIAAQGRDGVPFVRCANAELQFRCVAP